MIRETTDQAIAAGLVIDAVELLWGSKQSRALWAELCNALIPLGWRPFTVWDDAEIRLVLLPPFRDEAHYNTGATWWLTVETRVESGTMIVGARPLADPEADLDWVQFTTVMQALDAVEGIT